MIDITYTLSAFSLKNVLYDILSGQITTRLALQPIFSLSDMKIFGYEVLARWSDYNPEEIFRVAAQLQLVSNVEQLILKEVSNIREKIQNRFFVNVHPSIPNPTDWQLLNKTNLILEITEAAAIRFSAVQSLRDFGFSLALDDVGTGSATLEALAVIQPDFIKLDKKIIQLSNLKTRDSLLKALIDHSKRVQATLIVEGIETLEHLQTAKALGAPLAQGYYLAKPELI